MADDPLSTDKPVFSCLPGKRLIGKWGSVWHRELALKKLFPSGPVWLLLGNIRERFLFASDSRGCEQAPGTPLTVCDLELSARQFICQVPPLPLSNRG